MPVVDLANGRVERLVVDVEEAAPVQRPDRNRLRHPTCRESLEEVVGLLAVDDARERAVLSLHEDAAVQHHRDQEAGLALREPERGDRLRAVDREAVDIPALRRKWQRHTNSSARPPNRPPPRLPRLA